MSAVGTGIDGPKNLAFAGKPRRARRRKAGPARSGRGAGQRRLSQQCKCSGRGQGPRGHRRLDRPAASPRWRRCWPRRLGRRNGVSPPISPRRAASIVKELGAADAGLAAERLLRFIDTHGKVFDRIDDFGGRIQDVYSRAAKQAPELVEKLLVDERARARQAPDQKPRHRHPWPRRRCRHGMAIAPLL